MSFEDFRSRFAMLYHCRVLRTLREGGVWHRTLLSNEWRGATAGGCPNHAATWGSNPQFGLLLRRSCRVVLVLDQLQLAQVRVRVRVRARVRVRVRVRIRVRVS